MIIEVKSEDEMMSFGERFATSLRGGDVVELVGDVGAGKTTFTKGLARGLGVDEDVQSPSFTINRIYQTDSGIRLSHYDFYRLSDAGIMTDELSEAINDSSTIIVIEWADAIRGVLPENRITITFSSPSESTRKLEINNTLKERQ